MENSRTPKFATLDGKEVSESEKPGMVPVENILKFNLKDNDGNPEDVSNVQSVIVNDRTFIPRP